MNGQYALQSKTKFPTLSTFLAFACATLFQSALLHADPTDFAGTWHNELKSEMELHVDASGRITGTYRSFVGAGDHKPKEVVGFVDGNAIAFTVHFPESGATTVTSWVGHLQDGKIVTLWNLAFPAKPENIWSATWAGTDTFTTGPAPKQ